jgi:hypothetical protein
MRRALVIAGVMLAGLFAAAPSAGAAGPRDHFAFALRAGGFEVEGRSSVDGERVGLVLYRHGEVAYYHVPVASGSGDGTVRARFGRLGALDLSFRPGRGEGPLGCGKAGGPQQGTFVGSFVFRGEHDYAGIDAGRARGYYRGPRPEDCPRAGRDAGGASAAGRGVRVAPAPAPARASALGRIAETGVHLESRTGRKKPFTFLYVFTVHRQGHLQSAFEAIRVEAREGMVIERGAELYAGAAAFDWDLGDGTARLKPPAPFSGRAFYREGDGGTPRLTGSLRAPVLGGRPLRLTGSDFTAHLSIGSPFE